MKQYSVEFTASVTGSMAGRDDGQPYRSRKVGVNRITMLQFYKEKLDEKGKRYGWKPPKFSELYVTNIPKMIALAELEEYNKTKNNGEGI